MIRPHRWGDDAWLWALLALLLALRVPSLVQPLGPDQSLYAYVAQDLGRGGWPYLDAWDQKPPGIHLIYAALWAVYPDDSVIALADLAAAAVIAVLLVPLGAWWSGGNRAAGWTAACLFLLLGDPSWQRLGGLRVRAQCEVFIALAIVAAVWLAVRHRRREHPPLLPAAAGVLVGLAALLKYPAAIYGLVPAVVLLWPETGTGRRPHPLSSLAALAAGAALPVLLMVALYWRVGGLQDLADATLLYNMSYSGETYTGPWHFVRYLLSFPIQHARVDGLWLVGGAGALVMAANAGREPRALVLFAWLFCGMLAIAINGSRGLPQYFLQAAPAWALAAGLGATLLWARLGSPQRALLVIVVCLAVWRVVEADNLARALARDTRRLTGAVSAGAYLASFGERRGDKFRLASSHRLADDLAARTSPDDRVFVLGYAPGAYVYANRRSASRFFWGGPLVVGFKADDPAYGAAGLLASLERTLPKVIALQTDPPEYVDWFRSHQALDAWLRVHYEPVSSDGVFDVWARSGGVTR